MATIKKISLNGTTYDLGGGLTEDVKQASLQIAEKVAYIDEHGQDYYDELYTAFYDNMWNVTNTLSNAVNSNTATKTPKDGTYTAIISAATGYTLEGATVSVTMNGANITSSVYNNGTISIPSVTGDVVITVVAVALTVVSISAVYTQSGTVYDTDSLDSLKADLVVTATYSDSSTAIVPSSDYTLSGTLTAGTSTITISFDDATTTFEVTVTQLLPTGYTLLKWVEADGNQYVNTNISETEEFSAEYEVMITSHPYVAGNHILSSTNYYYPYLKGTTAMPESLFSVKRRGNESPRDHVPDAPVSTTNWWSLNQRYVIWCGWGNGSDAQGIKGASWGDIFNYIDAGSTASSSNKLTLFTYGGNLTNTNYRFHGRLYYVKLWQNNTLVHDYYPCKNASNIVGLYDRVTETFLSSATSTALIAGEVA